MKFSIKDFFSKFDQIRWKQCGTNLEIYALILLKHVRMFASLNFEFPPQIAFKFFTVLIVYRSYTVIRCSIH